jgi:hypothetical protein
MFDRPGFRARRSAMPVAVPATRGFDQLRFEGRPAVRQSELSAKTGGGANAGLMGIEENIKPFPSIPTVLGNHQKTVITTFAPHCDYY